jgi:hypothetical protein
MLPIDSFDDYAARLGRSILNGHTWDAPRPDSGLPSADDSAFNGLALRLFRLQFESVSAYRRLCESLGRVPGRIAHWTEIPAVPTSAFKELEFTSLLEAERTTVFHSSGTTGQRPSRHFHNAASLGLYEASLWPWFRVHLLADLDDAETGEEMPCRGRSPVQGWSEPHMIPQAGRAVPSPSLPPSAPNGALKTVRSTTLDRIRFLFLTPPAERAPHSSLVHMFETVRRHLGGPDCWFAGEVDVSGAWTLDLDRALPALEDSLSRGHPLALLGTAFGFVHLLDQLAERDLNFVLPSGSRVMETGGYKGRSRVLAQAGLHGLITEQLGIPASHIVGEYGMSELSSQAYDQAIGKCGTRSAEDGVPKAECPAPATERCFRFPPWARVRIVSSETGRAVADGEAGLIRVVDLANLRSVLAVQTEDLGVRRGTGFELIGRPAQVAPRGCSLTSAS